jgi:hypothetical protein
VTLYTTAELTALRDCQESFMDDACQIGTVSTTVSAIGADVESVAYATEQACGLQMLAGGERAEYRNGEMTIVKADAKVRLAHDTTLAVTSKVKITKRHGETLAAPIVYDVMGEPAVGASGMVAYLRKVTT